MRTGADALCAAMESSGITHALGLPGTQNLALWEALRRSRITPILTTHELAATFMASGFYRASGRPACVATIPGPGFTYALTGLAEALHDSAALLHVVGAPPPANRPFRFQSLEQERIAAPLAKAVRTVDDPAKMETATRDAVRLALAGEPGPVVLQWTVEALEGLVDGASSAPPEPAIQPPDMASLSVLAELLEEAKRPLLLCGQGCAGAADSLRILAERIRAPVLTTLSGRGVLPEDHPLALGFDFAQGPLEELNALIAESDLVVALGCKLSEAGTSMFRLSLPRDRLVHVDSSAAVSGTAYPARLALVARVEEVLERLLSTLGASAGRAAGWEDGVIAGWRSRLRASMTGDAEPRVRGAGGIRTVADLLAEFRRVLPRDTIVVADSGLHQTLIRRHLPVLSPRGLIVPSDFQSMGFGLPAAIGAKLAAPERPVMAVIGDGGFAMSGLELLTAVRERLPMVVVVFNDGQLNRIRLQQLGQYGHAVAVELLNPDLEGMALSMGARYLRAGADVGDALSAALRGPDVTLLEVELGDSPGLAVERAKGMVRGAVRRTLGPTGLRATLSRFKARRR